MRFEEHDPDPAEVRRVLDEAREWGLRNGMAHSELRRALRHAREELLSCKVHVNDLYTVHVRDAEVGEGWPPMVHLSIKRRDREPIHDWRELQEIKNAIVGPGNEGVELYPAESRLVDTANQFHLWVLKEPGRVFPFGYARRLVSDDSLGRSKNRPLPGNGAGTNEEGT